jgi:hypothetical protein
MIVGSGALQSYLEEAQVVGVEGLVEDLTDGVQ